MNKVKFLNISAAVLGVVMVISLVIFILTGKTFIYNETDRLLHEISVYAINVFAVCFLMLICNIFAIEHFTRKS